MAEADFNIQIQKEIANFTRVLEEGGVTSSIPPMFSYWANKYLSPRLIEVFGDPRINFIFASEINKAYKRSNNKNSTGNSPFRILSLGSGDCSTEIEIVKHLLDFGCTIEFVCTDLNPAVSDFAKDAAMKSGVDRHMTFKVLNLNTDFPDGPFDAVMANHSLHHFVELEFIFDSVRNALTENGVFVISDMIGRNGHMRWPEALVFVEQLWDSLPLEKKFNFFAKCHEDRYVNYDCTSDDTFEGIRAQDIMPLLTERFFFNKFVGHGNVIDVFIDRIYGNNFSPNNESDRRFIDYVESLNTSLIDFGIVKPTAMFATLSKAAGESIYSKWSSQFCVRETSSNNEKASVAQLIHQLDAMRRSTSWRITAPLRKLAMAIRR